MLLECRCGADMTQVSICDLHHWELVFIQIYRLWRHDGPTQAIAEHRIAVRYRDNIVFPLLDQFYALFRAVTKSDDGNSCSEWLRSDELLLFDLLSGDPSCVAAIISQFPKTNRSLRYVASNLQRDLMSIGIAVRSRVAMEPSEEERLERLICRSYRQIFPMP